MLGRGKMRLAFTVIVLGISSPLVAGELADFFSSIAEDARTRNRWPEPYVQTERSMIRQVWSVQVAAGWERQNLLSECHFLTNGTELTEAGRLRVQWIVNEAPEPYRLVYVHRANTPQETVARMAAVQRFVAQMPYAANVPVLESTRTDDGWPANRIDMVAKKAAATVMDPKLMGAATTGSK